MKETMEHSRFLTNISWKQSSIFRRIMGREKLERVTTDKKYGKRFRGMTQRSTYT